MAMWTANETERSANALLSKFFVAKDEQVTLEESKELCAWLRVRSDQLAAEDWLRLPAEVSAWPHTRWGTASASTICTLRSALVALSENLIKPLLQDLVDPTKSTDVLAALHEHLARTVGKDILELLPGLVVDSLEQKYILAVPSPAPDGSLSVRLPAAVRATLSTAKAKYEAAALARSILACLGQ
jgi:hypothetical protein